jgi:hypothetical protein
LLKRKISAFHVPHFRKFFLSKQGSNMENLLRVGVVFRGMQPNMGALQDIRKKFQSLIGPGRTFKSVNHMATETGIEQKSLKRFLDGDGGLTLEVASRAFDLLGVRVVFPGEINSSSPPVSPEAARVDEVVKAMRQAGMVPEAIRDGAVRELAAMFEKKTDIEQPKQTKRAS